MNFKQLTGGGKRLIVAAVVIGILGLGFGVLKISQGIRAYRARPTEEDMARHQAYVQMLQRLDEALEQTDNPEELDAARLIAGRPEKAFLTEKQMEDIREIYEDAIEKAKDGYTGRELARNMVTREIIYANQVRTPEDAAHQMKRCLILGGISILLGGGIAAGMVLAAGKKRENPAPSAEAVYNNKEF